MIRPWNLEMQLDFQAEKSVYLQIADAIIEAIRSGRLKKEKPCRVQDLCQNI